MATLLSENHVKFSDLNSDFQIQFLFLVLTLKLPGGGQMALPLPQVKKNVLLGLHVNLVYNIFDAY